MKDQIPDIHCIVDDKTVLITVHGGKSQIRMSHAHSIELRKA